MKRDKQFKLRMKEAENDLLLLQKEAFALQTEVDTGAGAETELKSLKKEWLMKEKLLRFLATRSPKAYSKKIKLLRVTSKSHIIRNKKAAKIPPVILSCTSKTLPLQDVLKDVKFRRTSFNRWLSNSPYSLSAEALRVHKQSFKLLQDIDVLAKKLKKILKMRQEVIGLKKAVGDAVKFLESNRSLITHCCSTLTSSLGALKPHLSEECVKLENTDVISVLNVLNTQYDVLKAQEETLNNDVIVESGRSSYQGYYANRFTNVAGVIPALQNAITITDDEIEAILRDCETEFPNRNFDEVFIPFEDVDYTENNSSYDGDYFITSTDKETEVQKAADTCNYEKDSTQFRSCARGTLLPLAAYEDGPSTASQITTDSSTIKRKQTSTCNTKVCNLPEERTSVDENDMIIHHLVQETCDVSVDPWSWLDPFLERNKPDDGDILSLEEWILMN
jgi:hypothetical protein